MAKRAAPPTASDYQVRALLERYRCPVPFHTVRTRFLGNIASPDLQVSPIKMVEALWGGALPTFDDLDAANELMGALIMGLWNRLTRHQERLAPFRLTRMEVPATHHGLRNSPWYAGRNSTGSSKNCLATGIASISRSGHTRPSRFSRRFVPWLRRRKRLRRIRRNGRLMRRNRHRVCRRTANLGRDGTSADLTSTGGTGQSLPEPKRNLPRGRTPRHEKPKSYPKSEGMNDAGSPPPDT